MKFYKINKNNSILFIIVILFVSLGTNVYTSAVNLRYEILVGKETYKSVEEIRHRNESILNTLNQCIKSGSVSDEELLRLYKGYLSISNEFTSLWSNYKSYKNGNIISINKKMTKSEEIPSEVYLRIESLLFEYLNIKMSNDEERIILENKMLDNFISMRDLSDEINDFYNEFTLKKFENMNEKDKEIISIRKRYWIDVLRDTNTIMNSYLNYEFTV